MEKACSRCKKLKGIKKFKVDKRQSDGRTITCRECYTSNKLEKFIRSPEQIESQRRKLLGRKYMLNHRLSISEGQKKAVQEGRHHWKVKDSRHPEQDRYSLKYKMWREAVLELKGKKCEICQKPNRLHIHHIKSYYEFPELKFEITNGQVLCISCHMKIHRNMK